MKSVKKNSNSKYYAIALISLVLFSDCKKEKYTQLKPTTKTTFTRTLTKLHATRGTSPGIYDAEGRFMILRGANYNSLGDYWQANTACPPVATYSPNDLKNMASYGFNCVRLLFSWSKLEPQKGVYDETYIQSINAAIKECAKNNIYVLIDMHQDAWGKYIATPQNVTCPTPNKGWDGAPEWATVTDGESTCITSGSRENAPAVIHAWQNFWDNTNGIQDACIASWQHLVTATCANTNVFGYDLINEPNLGYAGTEQTETEKASNYYGRLVSAIRIAEGSPENQHVILFENFITYNGTGGILAKPLQNFTSDSNIVVGPHHYFESIIGVLSIESGYAFYKSFFADYYQIPMFIGEWGYWGDPATEVSKVKRFAATEDANFGSSTFWQWAQAPGDPHSINWDGSVYSNTVLHLFELDQSANFTGVKNEIFLKVLARTRPNAIAGQPTKLTSNPDTGVLHLEATTTTRGITELWIPNYFGTPIITGTNIAVKDIEKIDGGYLAFVSTVGSYTIDVNF
jgi:endoglycosylceramidase